MTNETNGIMINEMFEEEGNQVVYYKRETGNKGYEQCITGPSLLLAYVEHNGSVEGPASQGGAVSIMIESDYIDHDYKDGSIEISPYGNNGYLIDIKGQWERMQFTKLLETLVNELKNIQK